MLRLVLVLVFVLAAAVWVIRFGLVRLQPDYARAGSALKIVERLALGQRSWLCLVQAGEKYLILGVSVSGVTLVTELSAGEMPPALPAQGTRDFKDILLGIKKFYHASGREDGKS
jgi:flagellar biosynthetic protein FliO